MYAKVDWEKNTIIKDSVHGYINIPKPIAKEIVDTDVFQRLKNIEQTGMQVLYPSATHNRFMHSLGVYHLSKKAFSNFMSNVRTDCEDVYKSVGTKYSADSGTLIQGHDATWRRWELMFHLASLLHDSGHSPFSHTLEFIYDLVQEPKTLSEELKEMCSPQFQKDFDAQATRSEKASIGKPHERMSALFVARGETAKKSGSELEGGFRFRIKKLLQSYMEAYGIVDIYKKNDKIFADDIEFMVRMIIGCHYELERADEYEAKGFHAEASKGSAQNKEWEIELQVRNCIIGMLNSKLDVDNLDYVVRDSKYSGYASNNIDLERLLSSFTIINAYECTVPIRLYRDDVFDASVNLDSFSGNFIDAKVSGACIVSSQNKNLNVNGNILTDTKNYSPEAHKKIFHTQDLFSATIVLDDSEGCITIKPKPQQIKAYLNISGHLEGELKGTILGDTVPYIKDKEGVKRRIYFAYKQNSMSVLMSAIEGSNFENKWVYAHHTTTFKNNYLTVYLLERYAEYLVDREVEDFLDDLKEFLDSQQTTDDMKPLSDEYTKGVIDTISNFLESCLPDEDEGYKAIQKCVDDKLLGNGINQIYELLQLFRVVKLLEDRRTADKEKIKDIIGKVRNTLRAYGEMKKVYDKSAEDCFHDKIFQKYINLGALEIQCFAKIMTMFTPNNIGEEYFFRTDDQDLLAKYKNLYHMLLKTDKKVQERYQEFIISYRHLITRTSMKCLWKSYPEYNFYFSDWTKDEIKELRHLLHRASTPWGENSGEKQKNYAILSDYVQLSDQAEKLWIKLKEDYGLTRVVYVEQDIRTKAFVRYETYLKNNERVVRLEDIRLYPDHQNNYDFFYIFYEKNQNGNGGKEFTPNNFLQEVRSMLNENNSTIMKEEETEKMEFDEKGNMIIRDTVHGDISFPTFFKALIDTKEFQRLRRIKQLATAGLVFPGAVHTRFSHSIGTYYIMTRILNHFKEYFQELNYSPQIDEREENAILAAALLHDLGHGPYSHAFEQTELSMGNKDHAEWTISIIKDSGTEIHSVLESFEEGFSEKVAGYIRCERETKNNGGHEIARLDERLNLKFIFASLVSGQIDADRMDYLLRDAKFSGVTCGQFDLEKVISGLAVSVENTGRYRVCIKEEYLDAVEEYFYARYQMYNNVYLQPYKMLSEELFRRILKEAQNAVLRGEISVNTVPAAIASIFTQSDILDEEYCKLDDTVVDGATHSWVESEVKVLAFLCKARINRKSYHRLEVLDYSRFREDAQKIFGNDVWQHHFIICLKKHFKMYDKEKPVYILKKNGIIVDFDECSVLAREETKEDYIYYSRDMAGDVYGMAQADLDEFERLLEKNHIYSNIEIEKKYIFPTEKMDKVEAQLNSYKKSDIYGTQDYGKQNQTDVYYDTQDFLLKKNDYTLRIREKADENYITCKHPINSMSNGIEGQLERVEYEEVVSSNSLMDNREIVEKFIKDIPSDFNIFNDLIPRIKIENTRTKIILMRKAGANKELKEKYEIAIDDVKYTNLKNKKVYKECQLEIELKSSYQNRINMKLLTDEIEYNLGFLQAIDESKYQRALKYTAD